MRGKDGEKIGPVEAEIIIMLDEEEERREAEEIIAGEGEVIFDSRKPSDWPAIGDRNRRIAPPWLQRHWATKGGRQVLKRGQRHNQPG